MYKHHLSILCATLLFTSYVNGFDINQAVNAVTATTNPSASKEIKTNTLVNMLSSQLNITDKQAAGGIGSILSYAKTTLPKNDYSTLLSAIPNASSLLGVTPKANQVLQTLSGGNSVSSLAALASQFSALGLKSDMIGKFVPIMLNYFKNSGKMDAMGILTKLFV